MSDATPAPGAKFPACFSDRLYPVPIFFDIETTGLKPESAGIVELCARVCPLFAEFYAASEAGASGAAAAVPPLMFASRVRPHCAIEADAQKIHGISLESLSGAPTFAQMYPLFERFCVAVKRRFADRGALLFVAHNAFGFDQPFLLRECARHHISFMASTPCLFADSLFMLRQDFGMREPGTTALAKLAQARLGAQFVQTHRACDDVDTLIRVVANLQQEKPVYELLRKRAKQHNPTTFY